jgi:glycosyltransferase involved in cell wall biosynthesis
MQALDPPVRIAFDVGPLSGPRTGIGAAVATLRDALERRTDLELRPYLTSFRADPADGVTRLPLPALAAHRLWARTDRPRVDRWLRPAQVVHGTNYVVPATTLPRLVSVYDCWFLRHPEQAHADVVRAGRVLIRALRHDAVAHVSSDATADALRELVPAADVRVVHLGAIELPPPADACPVAELDGVPFVLSVATLERRKNLPRLVAAFAAVAAAHPDVRLVLAGGEAGGRAGDRAAIDAAIDALPAEARRRVLLTGYVDDPVRSWLLHHATVLAYPSLDEGFGFPLLDAMQAGVPIVAAARGSIPEVAGDAAVLIDPLDVDALAAALVGAIDDDATRARLRAAAPAQLARFGWDQAAAGIADIYHALAGAPSGGTR